MNEENVMRMRQPERGVQTRNDQEYAMKKTFIGGARALDAFDAAAKTNPNP
jgi:hypothetical protein